MKKKGEKLEQALKSIAEQGRNFMAGKTYSYRAQNNAVQTLTGESVFILDPEMNQILASYNTIDSDYQSVQAMYAMMEAVAEE